MTRKQIALFHIIFWLVVLISPLGISFGIEGIDGNHSDALSRTNTDFIKALAFVLAPVVFYSGYLFSFRLLQKKRQLLILLAFLIIGAVPIYFYGKLPFFAYVTIVGTTLPWLALGVLFRLFLDWMRKDKETLILNEQNLKSELAQLKNQINPHFLFNSLHNIDSLIFVAPEKASEALINLSDILRQVLYRSDYILLSDEILILNKYISLQSLRTSNENLVKFEIGNIDDGVVIASMLLIPFVENAFKHTAYKKKGHAILIDLYTTNTLIYFNICNKYDRTSRTLKDVSHGIGLDNVKRRLELLYPNTHELKIAADEDYYRVELKIEVV